MTPLLARPSGRLPAASCLLALLLRLPLHAASGGERSSPSAARPLIFFHDSFWGRDFVHRNYSFQGCDASCDITFDPARAAEASAVFFHSVWTSRVAELPPRGDPASVWVWADAEAPGNWDHSLEQSAGLRPPPPVLDRLFNLSLTFRLDGDVLFSYGGAERLSSSAAAEAAEGHEARTLALFKGKSRLAAWTVSHCYTASRREEWVAALRRHAPVDVFGKCAGVRGIVAAAGHERHAARIRRTYVFYLALENRLCKDYVTEKFWVDALLSGAIPVVRGGLSDADYAAVAPPGSYVNADAFAGPAQLAAHMRAVQRNYSLFASYHAWRATHQLTVRDVHWHANKLAEEAATCRLCGWLRARRPGDSPATLNLTSFWDPVRYCRAPADVPPRPHLLCAGAADPVACREMNHNRVSDERDDHWRRPLMVERVD